MFDLVSAVALDPATAETVQTVVLTVTVLMGGLVALLSLPWTDAEISDVDHHARKLFRPLVGRGTVPECAADPVSSSR